MQFEEDWEAIKRAGWDFPEYGLEDPSQYTPEQLQAAEILGSVYERLQDYDPAIIGGIKDWKQVFKLVKNFMNSRDDQDDDESAEAIFQMMREEILDDEIGDEEEAASRISRNRPKRPKKNT